MFDDAVDGLDGRIVAGAARWQREAGLLKSVPGFGDVVSCAWLAEIGPAPHKWFSRHEKLASWVTLCPGNNISVRVRPHVSVGVLPDVLVCREPGGLIMAWAGWCRW